MQDRRRTRRGAWARGNAFREEGFLLLVEAAAASIVENGRRAEVSLCRRGGNCSASKRSGGAGLPPRARSHTRDECDARDCFGFVGPIVRCERRRSPYHCPLESLAGSPHPHTVVPVVDNGPSILRSCSLERAPLVCGVCACVYKAFIREGIEDVRAARKAKSRRHRRLYTRG